MSGGTEGSVLQHTMQWKDLLSRNEQSMVAEESEYFTIDTFLMTELWRSVFMHG